MLDHVTFLLKTRNVFSVVLRISLKIFPHASMALLWSGLSSPLGSISHPSPSHSSYFSLNRQLSMPACPGAPITYQPGILSLHCSSSSLILVWPVPIHPSSVSLTVTSSERSSIISQSTSALSGGQGSFLANNKIPTLIDLVKQFFLNKIFKWICRPAELKNLELVLFQTKWIQHSNFRTGFDSISSFNLIFNKYLLSIY